MDERAVLLQLFGRLSAAEPGAGVWRCQTLRRIQARLVELGVEVALPAAATVPRMASIRRRRRQRLERIPTPAAHAWTSRRPGSSAAHRCDAAAWAGGG